MKTIQKRITIFLIFFIVVNVIPPLFCQEKSLNYDPENKFQISREQFFEANERLRRSAKYHIAVKEMKRNKGIEYHDPSSLQKDIKYLSDQSLPMIYSVKEAVEKKGQQELQSAFYQTVLDLEKELNAKKEDGTLHKEAIKRSIDGAIYFREAGIGELNEQIASQNQLLEQYKKDHSTYKEENERIWGNNQVLWPEKVKNEYNRRQKLMQATADESKELREKHDAFEKSLSRMKKIKQGVDGVIKVIETYKDQKSNIEAYRKAYRKEEQSIEDMQTLIKMPVEAMKTTSDGLMALTDFLKEKSDKAKEEHLIFEYFEDAQKKNKIDVGKYTVEEQKAFYLHQDELVEQGEFLGNLKDELETFQERYKVYKFIDRQVGRLNEAAKECEKIDQQYHISSDARDMTKMFNVAGTMLEEIGSDLKKTGGMGFIGEVVENGGKGFKLVVATSMACANYKYKSDQGTVGEIDRTTDSRAVHQGERAYRVMLQVDQKIQERFGIEVRESWDLKENIVKPGFVVLSPDGEEAIIPQEDIPRLSLALSRLESIQGRRITQQEIFELANGTLSLRQFSPDNEHFEIDLNTGKQREVVLSSNPVDALAGEWGEAQEYHAGRYYTRCKYMDEVMEGVQAYAKTDGKGYKSFDELSVWEQQRLIRRTNRLNELAFLSGLLDELPPNIVSKLLNEEIELRKRMEDPDPEHPERIEQLTPTHRWLFSKGIRVMNDPEATPEVIEKIASNIEAERTYLGVGEIDGFNTQGAGRMDDPALLKEMTEKALDEIEGGFEQMSQEDADPSKEMGRKRPKEFAEPDELVTQQSIEDSERARELSREGEIGYSTRKIDDMIDNYLRNVENQAIRDNRVFIDEATNLLSQVIKDIGQTIAAQRQRGRDPEEDSSLEDPYKFIYKHTWSSETKGSSDGSYSGGELSDGVNLLGWEVGADGTYFENYDFSDTYGSWHDTPQGNTYTSSSGSWYYEPRGSENLKEYCAYSTRRYWSEEQSYVIKKCSAPVLHVRNMIKIYGPDTYLGCKSWLKQKGYW